MRYKWYVGVCLLLFCVQLSVAEVNIFYPDTFIGLPDTPSTYSGQAGNCVVVNGSETSVVFSNCSSGGGTSQEQVDDWVHELITNTTEIQWDYNDLAGTLLAHLRINPLTAGTIVSTSNLVFETSSNTLRRTTFANFENQINIDTGQISNFDEGVEDVVGMFFDAAPGDGLYVVYNDPSNTLHVGLDFENLAEVTSAATADRFAIYSDDLGENRYITTGNLGDSIAVDISHNSLDGLQGGTSGQYYHLTLLEQAAVEANYTAWNALIGGGGGGGGNPFDQVLNTTSHVIFSSTNVSNDIDVGGDAYVGSDVFINGNPARIELGNPTNVPNSRGYWGDSNTFFVFSDNLNPSTEQSSNLVENCNGFECLLIQKTGGGNGDFIHGRDSSGNVRIELDYLGGVRANMQGLDSDSYFQGDTDSELLYVNAGADTVGVGEANPLTKFHVQGDSNVTGNCNGCRDTTYEMASSRISSDRYLSLQTSQVGTSTKGYVSTSTGSIRGLSCSMNVGNTATAGSIYAEVRNNGASIGFNVSQSFLGAAGLTDFNRYNTAERGTFLVNEGDVLNIYVGSLGGFAWNTNSAIECWTNIQNDK